MSNAALMSADMEGIWSVGGSAGACGLACVVTFALVEAAPSDIGFSAVVVVVVVVAVAIVVVVSIASTAFGYSALYLTIRHASSCFRSACSASISCLVRPMNSKIAATRFCISSSDVRACGMRGLEGLSMYALPPAEWCPDPNTLLADPFVAPLRECDEAESAWPDLARVLVLPAEAGVLLAACRERGRLRLLGLPGAAPDPAGPLSFESVPALPAVAEDGIVRDVAEDDDFADFEDRERDDFSAVDEVPASSSEAMPACSWFRFQAV